MSEFRSLRLCLDDIEAMEKAGEELMRSHKTAEGLPVLAAALRLRQAWSMYEPFACNVDESAGLADDGLIPIETAPSLSKQRKVGA